MNWFILLGLAALLTAVAAVTGMKPKGTRHVAHTKLMGAARAVLVVMALVLAVFAARGYLGR